MDRKGKVSGRRRIGAVLAGLAALSLAACASMAESDDGSAMGQGRAQGDTAIVRIQNRSGFVLQTVFVNDVAQADMPLLETGSDWDLAVPSGKRVTIAAILMVAGAPNVVGLESEFSPGDEFVWELSVEDWQPNQPGDAYGYLAYDYLSYAYLAF